MVATHGSIPMNNRDTPLYWSFPAGTWFETEVRISVYFPLVVLLLCFHLESWRLGLVFSGILFLSVVVHEFGHVLAARMTGGSGNNILIWPLGGLAFVRPAGSLHSQLLTPAAGPLANLIFCAITLPAVMHSGQTIEVLNPLIRPSVTFTDTRLLDLLVLTCDVNWLLWLLNLIPVFPLDGGRILQVGLRSQFGGETATRTYIRAGFVVAFAMMFVGLIMKSPWMVFFGAILLTLNMQESFQLQVGDAYDESFMGYDFSQGYTSLERSSPAPARKRAGWWKRWKARREAERREREHQQDIEVVGQLDALLEKVHVSGIDSLTDAEKRLLDRASARFREKGRQTDDG